MAPQTFHEQTVFHHESEFSVVSLKKKTAFRNLCAIQRSPLNICSFASSIVSPLVHEMALLMLVSEFNEEEFCWRAPSWRCPALFPFASSCAVLKKVRFCSCHHVHVQRLKGAVSPSGILDTFLQCRPLERPFLPSRRALSRGVFISSLSGRAPGR